MNTDEVSSLELILSLTKRQCSNLLDKVFLKTIFICKTNNRKNDVLE